MQKITLTIENPREHKIIALEDELTVGRTNQASVAVDDVGLSRVNTTFFRDGDKIFVVDENSLNGTFLNGENINNQPHRIFDGDLIKLGSETNIRIEIIIDKSAVSDNLQSETPDKDQVPNPTSNIQNPKSDKPPFILIVAAVSAFSIIFAALIAIFIVSRFDKQPDGNRKPTPQISDSNPIPQRVLDPLGGLLPEELQELADYWEAPEAELKAADLRDVTVSAPVDSKSPTAESAVNLKVSVAFWQNQRNKALEARSSPTGNDPPGQQIPIELRGDGVVKQKAKLAEMLRRTPPYQLPMDFADLARKRMAGELMELPMATEDYVLEVGGSSTSEEFTGFDFVSRSTRLAPDSADYKVLEQLAANFSGEKYDLNNPDHRRQMKIRLLRMFHPQAFPVLNRLARAYREKFNRPLRVTSLQRSMEYQISLNKTNPNSFMVRGAGSLPPHTSGCAFDLARKHLTADEQNFVMAELAKMEREGILDALREGNLNACFHVFVYDDGKPPKM